jgi:hypothetical protein
LFQVRLCNVGDLNAKLGGRLQHPVDVALRIDHEGDLPVGDQVAAVAQRRGLDRHYPHLQLS